MFFITKRKTFKQNQSFSDIFRINNRTKNFLIRKFVKFNQNYSKSIIYSTNFTLYPRKHNKNIAKSMLLHFNSPSERWREIFFVFLHKFPLIFHISSLFFTHIALYSRTKCFSPIFIHFCAVVLPFEHF